MRIEGTDGNDIIEVIVDGPSISYVDAGAGNDSVTGSEQADVIVGGSGDDVIDGLGGNDWLHGGSGNDTLDGGAGDDFVVGGWDDDVLSGGADEDTVYGGYGDDVIHDQEGLDYIYGGSGNDTFYGSNDVYDNLYGGAGDDTFFSIGRDHIFGGQGNDFIDVSSGVGASSINVFRGEGHDVVKGGITNDWSQIRFGNTISEDDLFFTRTGNDLKILVLGENQSVTIQDYYESTRPRVEVRIHGSWYVADSGGTSKHGAIDALVARDAALSAQPVGEYNIISDSVLAERSDVFEAVWSHIDLSHANSQVYRGISSLIHSSQNILYGGDGNDFLSYSYTESSASVYLYGGSGDDDLQGGVLNDILGNDQIYAGLGDDVLQGQDGDDVLYGGAGSDVLSGGTGVDHLYGGSGSDTFVFENGTAFLDMDVIEDFSLTDGDKIDISDLLENYDPLADVLSDFVQIIDDGTSSYLSVDSDGGADNFMQIAVLHNVTALTDEDMLEANGALVAT